MIMDNQTSQPQALPGITQRTFELIGLMQKYCWDITETENDNWLGVGQIEENGRNTRLAKILEGEHGKIDLRVNPNGSCVISVNGGDIFHETLKGLPKSYIFQSQHCFDIEIVPLRDGNF